MASTPFEVGQALICDLPFRFDTYSGCSHKCAYCFVTKKNSQKNNLVEAISSAQTLKKLLSGQYSNFNFYKNFTIHWGGLSDPFQPIEKQLRRSYECLKVFADTQHSFVVSTKGKLIAEPEYLELLKQCNCAVQISMLCSEYDRIETGAPTYEERLEMLRKVSPCVKRTLVRLQPYVMNFKRQIIANFPRIKDAGAYGVIVEAIKYFKKRVGTVKVGGDYIYPLDTLRNDIKELKEEAHKVGLKFFVGENRLRTLGDDLCCCGVADLEGFKVNKYNINHLLNRDVCPECDDVLKLQGSGVAVIAYHQEAGLSRKYRGISFREAVDMELKNNHQHFLTVFGKKA